MSLNHRLSRFHSRTWVGCLTCLGLVACGNPESRAPAAAGTPERGPAAAAAPSLDAPVLPTVEVYLRAEAFDLPAMAFNNPAPIRMWGFAECKEAFTSCGQPTVPGPALGVEEGGTLTIHVINGLAGPYVEPVSVVIPGQAATMNPVWFDPVTGSVTATGARPAGDYTSRVRSFTAETPPDGATVTSYSWTGLRAGTYLYQSGSHPAVQMQMGLFGALLVYPVNSALAYPDPSTAFDAEVTLLFSEIDPVLHDAIAAGLYGSQPPSPPPAGWLTSTIEYRPQYFFINGQSFRPAMPVLPAGVRGGRLLIRFLNAGLSNRVPAVQGPYMSVIAEDGHPYMVTSSTGSVLPAPREQYSVLLPAGKTVDAILVPAAAGDIPVYDRRFGLSNAGTSPGGMLVYLAVAGTAPSQQPLRLSTTRLVFNTAGLRAVTVRNTGISARVITGAEIVGGGANPAPDAFSVSNTAPVTLAGGSSATFLVSFNPTTTNPTALLNFSTNDPLTPLLTVRLVGIRR
ncbi:MAG: hypothetical protein HY904_14175 [Deltaproteobacteria bacterium]|nr:hypothetical protein [Deltaproteobacteria bacterium]